MLKKIMCGALVALACAGTAFAQDLSVTDLGGAKVSLSSLKGKNAILFFFTTWCPYCRKELTLLNSQYAVLKQEGVEVLPIDVAESAAKVLSFSKSHNLTFPIYLDEDSSVTESYEVLGVPTYILIDAAGATRYKGHSFPRDYKKLTSQGTP